MKKINLLTLALVAFSLTSCKSKEKVIIYTASEEDKINLMQTELNQQFPNYEIIIQSFGTGTLTSKLKEEGKKTDCDIFYDLEAANTELLLAENNDLFADLSEYDYSIYTDSVLGYTSRHKKYAITGKTYAALIINKDVLQDKDLAIPTTYTDLIKTDYKDLVVMPNPKSSGTGFSLYNGLLHLYGETDGLAYFDSLNSNIREYTTSGSAPAKAVVRGEAGIGVALLWNAVIQSNANTNITYSMPEEGLPYALFTMGMINGHQSKTSTKEVFSYIYNDLNKKEVVLYNPAKIYKDQGPSQLLNYPENIVELEMPTVFDHNHKADLLAKWKF